MSCADTAAHEHQKYTIIAYQAPYIWTSGYHEARLVHRKSTLSALADDTLPLLLFLLAEVPTFGLLLREAKPQVEASSKHRFVKTSLCNLLQSKEDLMRGVPSEMTGRASMFSPLKVPVPRQRSVGIPRFSCLSNEHK